MMDREYRDVFVGWIGERAWTFLTRRAPVARSLVDIVEGGAEE